VIGAALDLGSGRRGVDMGPSAIRYAQLGERIEEMGLPIHDHGNVRTGMVEALDQGDPSARYWSAIKRTCEELADHVAATVNDGEMPLVLGGDHSIAIGTLGGLARAHAAPGGVVWLDAHTDINTPTIGVLIYWANQHTALVAGIWWWIFFPVLLVVTTFIGLFLLAVSMNEYIDPRSRLGRSER